MFVFIQNIPVITVKCAACSNINIHELAGLTVTQTNCLADCQSSLASLQTPPTQAVTFSNVVIREDAARVHKVPNIYTYQMTLCYQTAAVPH